MGNRVPLEPPGLFFSPRDPNQPPSFLRFEPTLPTPPFPQGDPIVPLPGSRTEPLPAPPGQVPRLEATIPNIPMEHDAGYRKYLRWCASCHGSSLEGNDKGPPLLHEHYAQVSHSDATYYRTALRGSPARHWNFGPMPPLPGITRGDLSQIVPFIRWYQKQFGIDEETATRPPWE